MIVAYRVILIAFIKTHEPPIDEVYMVQEEHPYWSKYGYIKYGIGDIWVWTFDFASLSIKELKEIVIKLER